jgi:glycosyltransferase involved in cell wall biosynthesis
MILTVAIPTYNRPEKVLDTVRLLLPQLNDTVKVLILDNHSEVDVHQYLHQHLQAVQLTRVIVVRHKVNIGPDANFARCFELCETEYIWTLGDDDLIETNAVKLILDEIALFSEKDVVGFNFKSNCCKASRSKPVVLNSISDFVTRLDDFGALLFLSAGVYKVKTYLQYIRLVTWGGYTMASQLIPAMMAISKGSAFILSEKYIVTNVPEPDHDKGWSPVQLALGLSAILEAPVGYKGNEYKEFGLRIAAHFNCLYPLDAMFIIIRSLNNNIDKIDNYHIYLFNQVILKTFEFRDRKVNQRIQYYMALSLLKNKSVLKLLFKLYPKLWQRTARVAPFSLFRRD